MDLGMASEGPGLAESTAGLLGKLPHDSSVTVWPCTSMPYGLQIPWHRTFAFGLADADEEVQLPSVHW